MANARAEALRGIPLFSDLSSDSLEGLAEAAKEVELDDGDVDRAAEDDGSREPDSLRDRHQEAFPDRPHVSAAPAAPVGGRGP